MCPNLRSDQQPGFWVYIRDYTTQLYRDYNNDKDSLLTKQFHGGQQRCRTLLNLKLQVNFLRQKAWICTMFHRGWLELRHSLSISTPLQWGFNSDVARVKRVGSIQSTSCLEGKICDQNQRGHETHTYMTPCHRGCMNCIDDLIVSTLAECRARTKLVVVWPQK